MANKELIKSIDIPKNYRKATTLAKANFYDKIEVYGNRVIGYKDNNAAMTWYFKDYNGIDIIHAGMNSQFSQVVFLTGMNTRRKFIGIDLSASQNTMAMQDTNRIIFCAGMISFSKSNEFADEVGAVVKSAFDDYKMNEDEDTNTGGQISIADELTKFKNLLDQGIITQEEFDAQKKKLLRL